MKKKLLFIIMFFFILYMPVVKAADVAKIGDTTYPSLTEAIGQASGQTTIVLLMDTSENITIPSGKNIILDLNNKTLRNSGNSTVINNNGRLEIINGTITTDAKSGMINNNKNATLTLNEGQYIATGLRQVVYNKEGTLYIGGTAYLESNTSVRATVHNLTNGKAYITGGTIVSNIGYAIYNDTGSVTIGSVDDLYNKTTPVIQGYTYGIVAFENVNVYDGIIKGGTHPIGTATSANEPATAIDTNETKIEGTEANSTKAFDVEVIGSKSYTTLTYDIDYSNRVRITFNPVGGNVNPTYTMVNAGDQIGTLPNPTKKDNEFIGWFTEETGGTQITESSTPNTNATYYAHWNYVDPNTVAHVEGIGDMSLANAFATGGKITLNRDVIIDTNLGMTKAATLDLNGHTISMGDNAIIIKEDVTITDSFATQTGKITSTNEFTVYVGVYNTPTNGKLTLTGGTIEGLGQYGAIRNYETLIIDGGTVQGTATDSGYLVYNDNNMIMKSGVINSGEGYAVQVYDNATFTMDGGLIKTTGEHTQALNLHGNCTATINGGTIEGLEYQTAGIAAFGGSVLIINGGTIAGSAMAVSGNGSEQNGNVTITVNDGTLTATDGVAMYLPQMNSTTVINGGYIAGPTGIEIRAGNLTINDGTIIGTSPTYSVTANGNGTTTTGAALGISQHNTKQPIEVTINGGSLKAPVPLCDVNPMNNPPEAVDLIVINIRQGDFESTIDDSIETYDTSPIAPFITGGTYSTDPSKYVKEGYGVIIEENKYKVVKLSSDEDEEEVKGDDIINPPTGDNIFTYVLMLTFSALGLISVLTIMNRIKDIN